MHTTFRRLNLRPALSSTGTSIRHFIHNSQCASVPLHAKYSATATEPAHDNARIHSLANDSRMTGQLSFVVNEDTPSDNSSQSIEDSSKRVIKPAKKRAATKRDETTTPMCSSKPKKPSRKLIGPPTKKIEAFLQIVESEKDTLTLADVERYKPSTIPDTRSPQYEEEYDEIMANLTRSFNLLTMQKIFALYSIPQLPLSRQKKVLYAQAILDYWGWTPIAVVRDIVLDETKSSELRFPLRHEEAFLLMGQDGSELLSLAKRYNVNLSFYDNPMTLKASGLQGSLKRLAGYIKGFKKDIQSEAISMHYYQSLPFETIKAISRLSGAYLAQEKNKFRVYFHKNKPWTLKIAENLAVQVASGQTARTILSIYSPTFALSGAAANSASAYSLYPFSPQGHISWKIPSSSSFRLRRVGQWLDPMKSENDTISTHDFDTYMQFDESDTDLKTQLLGQSPILDYSSVVISAYTGHCLFLSSASQSQTLIPPLIGRLDRTDIFKWAREFPERVVFQPSIPIAVLTCSMEKEQRIRKLVYVERATTGEHFNSRKTFNLELAEQTQNIEGQEVPGPLFYFSKEINVNVMFPDRFTDLQLSMTGFNEILPYQIPAELLSHIERLESRSHEQKELAPSEIEIEGAVYTLSSDTYVHREFKNISLQHIPTDVLVETQIDAGIGRSSIACKISCENYSTTEGWGKFMKQCNAFATTG